MATFKMMDGDAIKTMTTSIGKRFNLLDSDVHKTAVSIVNHVNEYHEVSLANNLIGAMGKGSRVNALREWFQHHLKASFDEKEQVFVQSVKGTALSNMTAVLLAPPWFEHKAEAKFIPVDVEKLVKSAIDRITKAIASGDKRHKCKMQDLVLLQTLQTQLGCSDDTEQEEAQVQQIAKAQVQDAQDDLAIDPLAAVIA